MESTTVGSINNRIILITGIMASGKSTVAQLLAERIPGSVHIRGDIFRKMIVSGRVEKSPDAIEEADRQLELRYRLAAQAADTYFQAGFNVVVQDVILGEWLGRYVNFIQGRPLHVIVLDPSEEEVSKREQERGKTGYGEWSVSQLNQILQQETPRRGLWLDSSELSAHETVEQIMLYLDAREGLSEQTHGYLDRLTELFISDLQNNLAGIYLHGSLAMGCFHPDRSDIDLLVVVKEAMAVDTKKIIAQKLLELHREMPGKRGMEISIILERYAKGLVYPTPFEFHYSDAHRERYETDPNYVCGGLEDPDLAAHLMVTYHRGVMLDGKPIREMFKPVDPSVYMKSIVFDIEDAAEGMTNQPVYYALNLCRVLFYLKEGVVSSKKEGGEWGQASLPSRYRGFIRQCLDYYSGMTENIVADPLLMEEFTNHMLAEIRERVSE